MKYIVTMTVAGRRTFEKYGLPYIHEGLTDSVKEVGPGIYEIEADSKYDLVDYLESCGVYQKEFEFEEV